MMPERNQTKTMLFEGLQETGRIDQLNEGAETLRAQLSEDDFDDPVHVVVSFID